MTETTEPEPDTPRVLVPVEVLEDTPEPSETTRMVGSVDVVVLGYYHVPEQTPPGQMRMQYEDEAREELEAFADRYRETGADVTPRLVFTHDPAKTFARTSNEEGCNAILLPRPAESMQRLMVPIRGEANLSRLVHVTARLLRDNDVEVMLLHVREEDEEGDAGELLLRGAREQLVDEGVDPERIHTEVKAAEHGLEAVIEAAQAYDGLVLGETEPSLRDIVLGEAHERIAEGYAGPILVVRREMEGQAPSVPEDA